MWPLSKVYFSLKTCISDIVSDVVLVIQEAEAGRLLELRNLGLSQPFKSFSPLILVLSMYITDILTPRIKDMLQIYLL